MVHKEDFSLCSTCSRVVELRSYFEELWQDPELERFLYPLFYTVPMINLLFCALKLRKVELVLQCRPKSGMSAIKKIFPCWNWKVTRHWGDLFLMSLLALTHSLWGRGLFISYLLTPADGGNETTL